MKRTVLFSSLIALFLGAGTYAAFASDDGEKKSRKQQQQEKKLAKIESKYNRTGTMKRCVSVNQLRRSDVLDDQTIFFESTGKRAYLNKLKRVCPRLYDEDRFSYRVHSGQLCANEVITVINDFGQPWFSCGLGEFELLEKKSKQERKKEKAVSEKNK